MTSASIHQGAERRPIAIWSSAPYWVVRWGAALCFIGHGAFGFITKAAWLPYFAVAGIPESWAWRLMPLVGAVDVLAGMAVLFAPRRLPLVYMAFWGLWTALLRPLAGESVFQTLERAGNYGVPFALLLLAGLPRSWRGLLAPAPPATPDGAASSAFRLTLQASTVLLLAGHGALGVLANSLQITLYASIGLSAGAAQLLGWCEIAVAALIAVRPTVSLLLFVAVWKVLTESLFLVAGLPLWEFVERGGSYAAPVALAFAMMTTRDRATLRPG